MSCGSNATTGPAPRPRCAVAADAASSAAAAIARERVISRFMGIDLWKLLRRNHGGALSRIPRIAPVFERPAVRWLALGDDLIGVRLLVNLRVVPYVRHGQTPAVCRKRVALGQLRFSCAPTASGDAARRQSDRLDEERPVLVPADGVSDHRGAPTPHR